MNKEELIHRLKELNINWITNFINLDISNSLFITNCCKDKAKIERGISKELYISLRNQKFYKIAEENNLIYYTLSDSYGLVSSTQILENYNLHPSDLSLEGRDKLTNLVYGQIKKINEEVFNNKLNSIIFYGISPMQSLIYLSFLQKLSINKYLINKFDYLINIKLNKEQKIKKDIILKKKLINF